MKKMTKVLTTVFVIALAALTLAGCAKKDTSPVTTDGSTSMEKVIGTLGEAFTEKEGINVTYNPTGSGSGIQAVSEGRCDIGLSSRALKDDEKATLTETVVALDGIAMIVNPENPVSDLTVEQIADIYTGKITNWSEVGGSDAEIVLIGREAGSGTRDGFESITGTKDACQYRQELTSTGDVITTVSQNPEMCIRDRPYSLYSQNLVTFGESDFNQAEAAGFINIWGLPTKVQALREQGKL